MKFEFCISICVLRIPYYVVMTNKFYIKNFYSLFIISTKLNHQTTYLFINLIVKLLFVTLSYH